MNRTKPPVRRGWIPIAAASLALTTMVAVGPPAAAADPQGQVWTVGLGSDGQLGSGSTGNRSSFGVVSGLSGVVEVAGGREHVVALTSGGGVRTWGDGSKGALGNGSNADQSSPVTVPGLSNVRMVAAGHYHSLALLSDGTLRTWGYNAAGQLGDGSKGNKNSPVTVSGLSGVVAMAAGRDMSYSIVGSGAVRAWGLNSHGELGDGTTTSHLTPVAVSGVSNAIALAAGRNHGLALLSNGTIKAWGLNDRGQLGDGTKVNRTNAVTVLGISNAVAIGAGADHSLAVLADGRVMSWGRGYRGALGSGNTADRLQPAYVNGLPSNVVTIDAGRDHSLAITANGQLWAWGYDSSGQLGDGKTSNRLTPYQVPGINNAVMASGGFGYTALLQATSGGGGDTQAPTTPGTPTATSTSSGRVDLSFGASSDDQASSLTYRVYRDGASNSVGSVTSSSTGQVAWSETGLSPGSTHTYRVDASDGTNISAKSATSDSVTVAGGGGGGDVILASSFAGFPAGFTNVQALTADASRFSPGDSAPSVRAQPSNALAYAYAAFGSSESSACAAVDVRFDSVGTKAVAVLKLRTQSGVVSQLNVAPSRKVQVRSVAAGRTFTSTYTLALGSWTTLEMCTTTGPGGSLSLKVGGTARGSWSVNTGNAAMTRVQIGDNTKKTTSYSLDALRITR